MSKFHIVNRTPRVDTWIRKTPVILFPLRYLCKAEELEDRAGLSQERRQRRGRLMGVVHRVQSRWRVMGSAGRYEGPEYFYVGSRPQDGAEVLRNPKRVLFWDEADESPFKRVGRLVKRESFWRIEK